MYKDVGVTVKKSDCQSLGYPFLSGNVIVEGPSWDFLWHVNGLQNPQAVGTK